MNLRNLLLAGLPNQLPMIPGDSGEPIHWFKEAVIVLVAILALTLLLAICLYILHRIRQRARNRKRQPTPTKHSESRGTSHRRRRHRRRKKRKNPTLAESGGLPPKRTDGSTPDNPPAHP